MEGHADFYPGLELNFIPGNPPDFVCFKAEEEVERRDLSTMDLPQIHDLVQGKGYKRVMPVSLAAKAAQGEEITTEDWTAYIDARHDRKMAREEWDADAMYRRVVAIDAVLASQDPPVGTSGKWLVSRKKGEFGRAQGTAYRNSMVMTDKAVSDRMAKFNTEVQGVLVAEGWVRVASEDGDHFLPTWASTPTGDLRLLRLIAEDSTPSAKSEEL